MLNKNDPLIGAVQEVMKRNQAEREAAKLVNEKFGVTDRKAMPHERLGEWDAVYKSVLTEGVEALDEDWDSKKRNKAEKIEAGAKKIRSNRQGHIKDFGKMIANRTRQDAVTGDDTAGRASKAMKDLYGKNKGDRAAIEKISEEEALDEAKIDHPNKRKLDVAKPYGELTSDDFRKLRAMKEEEQIDEKAPPGREDQVKTLKKKVGTEKAYKFAWASYKKNKKLEEGFNDRHSLSENASAEKQTVAVLNEDTSEYMDQEYERRGLQPPGGGMPGGGALKNTKFGGGKIRFDRGLKYVNTATGKKLKQTDLPRKKRAFVKKTPAQQQQQPPAQQQGPAKPPSGTFLDKLAAARRNAGSDLKARQLPVPRGSTQPVVRGRPDVPLSTNRTNNQSVSRQVAKPNQSNSGTVGKARIVGLSSKGKAAVGGLAAGMGGAAYGISRFMKNQPDSANASTGKPKSSTTQAQAAADSQNMKKPPATQTSSQPDFNKMTFGQAFKTARETAKKQGDPSLGKFKYKGKEYQTNIKGTGTAKKPQEKYQPASKLRDVTPAAPKPVPSAVPSAAPPSGTVASKPASSPMASQGSSGATQSKILPQRKSSGSGTGGGGGGGW